MKSRHISGLVSSCALGLLLLGSPRAQGQTRYPVISKVRIVFSMVSHHNTIANRVVFYDTFGNPQGNANYAVPHLVYEPVVTLYNPYPDVLSLTRCRIRISDPPVGFSFRKNNIPLRTDFGNHGVHPLGRFQIANENNLNARKIFTLYLRERNSSGVPGDSIILQPGESREFSPWVEDNWTWSTETAGGHAPHCFHDWNIHDLMTTEDHRTENPRGVETVGTSSGAWDYRAGFQVDLLSLSNGARPANTLYPFESPQQKFSSFVVVKLTDTVTVQAKAMGTSPGTGTPYFKVDMLRGMADNADADVHRSFTLTLPGLSTMPQPVFSTKTYQVGAILQRGDDPTHGGKTPFAMVSMVAKPEALEANTFYQTPFVPTADLYEVKFDKLNGYPSLGFPNVPGEGPALEVSSAVRDGNTMSVDFSGDPGIESWRVMGTADLAAGFTEDLTSLTTFTVNPVGSGKVRANIDLTGKGANYFVRIESAGN